jgi:DNA-binding transcriptional MerR regulator
MYYSISEVCELTGLEQHVLRYWEAEIPQLRPKKNSAGNRAYREKDIELIRRIKSLLYDEKLSIQGVKQRLTEERKTGKQNTSATQKQELPKPETEEPPKPRTKALPEEPEQTQLDLLPEIAEDKPEASTTSTPSNQSALLAEIRAGLEEVLALLESH